MGKQPQIHTSKKRSNKHKPILSIAERLAIRANYEITNNYRETARQLRIAPNTVKAIIVQDKEGKSGLVVAQIKKNIADSMYLTAAKSINQINDVLDKASAKDAAVITGIMIDKARLIEGESTANQSVHVWLGLVNSVPVDGDFDKFN